MWKTILSNINALILASWKSIFMFVCGAVAGIFLLSCSAVTAVEETVSDVDSQIRDIPYAGRVYEIPSNLVGDVYGLGKDVVEGVVDVVTPEEDSEE